MAKKVFYGDDARQRILAGAEALYEAVKVTYGPKGGNVVIGHNYYGPSVTHDGVTVAQAVELDDSEMSELGQKVGAELIKQAASNLNKIAGDGTTTVTILTYNILKEANRLIAAGHNPQELRKGIEQAGEIVLAELEKMAEVIDKDSPRVKQIATISAGDAEIGKILAEVVAKVGKDSAITVEISQGTRIEAEVVEGFSFDYGWTSPLFVTDTQKQQAVYEHPAFIICDGTISTPMDIAPLIAKVLESGKKELVIIADEMDKDVLSALVLNKMKEILNVVVVKAPGHGESRKEALADIATFTGATVLEPNGVATLATAELAHLGSCRKIIVEQGHTIIIDGKGAAEDVATRIGELRGRKEASGLSELDKDRLDKRIASLGGKVAVVKVGGATETEIDERKYRVDDAVAAVQAALAEGIVTGGGTTLLHLSEKVKRALHDKAYDAGYGVLERALRQPFLQIMENAGLNGPALIERVGHENGLYDSPVVGVDIMNNAEIIDMKKAGVVDPVRVTKETIKNSVSIAATAATMGALVVDLPEKSIANNA